MPTMSVNGFEMALATKTECRRKFIGTTMLQKCHMLCFTSCLKKKSSAAKYWHPDKKSNISDV